MNTETYRQIRAVVILFIGLIVLVAVFINSYLLAAAAVITGMLFLILVRGKTVIRIDEREKSIREKAAQITYAIFAPVIGIGAFLMLIPSQAQKMSPVFAGGEFVYLESLGMVFAYLTLFLIAIYAISYHFLNQKYGGGNYEE